MVIKLHKKTDPKKDRFHQLLPTVQVANIQTVVHCFLQIIIALFDY